MLLFNCVARTSCRSNASTARQNASTMTSTPSAVGCSPSGWLSWRRRDAFEKERIERHVVVSWRAPDRSRRNARRSRRRNCGGACMPHSRTAMLRAFSRVRIWSSAARVTAGSSPRSASLAPSSRITACGSVRDRPVEPVEPAGRGVAGDAGIDHLDRDPLGLQRLLQLCREGRRGRQAEAGAQGIAERDHLHRLGLRWLPACRATAAAADIKPQSTRASARTSVSPSTAAKPI